MLGLQKLFVAAVFTYRLVDETSILISVISADIMNQYRAYNHGVVSLVSFKAELSLLVFTCHCIHFVQVRFLDSGHEKS